MILLPSLDLQGGKLVRRLADGSIGACDSDPAETAQAYAAMGFEGVHVFDRDAAMGQGMNAGACGRILAASPIPVQVSGGIAAINRLTYWLEAGATRVVLDSGCMLDPGFLGMAASLCADRIAGSVEISQGSLIINGKTSMMPPEDAARRFTQAGMRTILVIDRDREGRMQGCDAALMARMAHASGAAIIACGGVTGAHDIDALRLASPRIRGAVIGRALADGGLQVDAALKSAAA